MIFLLISCWICLSTAASISAGESPRPTLPGTEPEAEVLLIDPRIPVFVDGHWQIMSDEEHRELRRRAAAPKETSQPAATATATTEIVIDASTVTDSASPAATTTAAASPLPSPFDGALAANFSGDDACPTYINEFLSNATFKACYPISLLLQVSLALPYPRSRCTDLQAYNSATSGTHCINADVALLRDLNHSSRPRSPSSA